MILQASFYWQNDKPGGLGFTFGPPSFSPEELTAMFEGGDIVKTFIRESDAALGTNLVNDYIAQLTAIGQAKERDKVTIPLQYGIMAALSIMWLASRGFIPNDEFNGAQIIYEIK